MAPFALAHAAPPLPSCALTYLEINGWLLSAGGVTLLCDPVLEGPLDFGIPWAYSASKRVLPQQGLLEQLPAIDALLITQGLDDHAHAPTLERLGRLQPTLPVIAPPSARPVLEGRFSKVTYVSSSGFPYPQYPRTAVVKPSRSPSTGAGLTIKATKGALVGPPWQRRENGYVITPTSMSEGPSIYIEPHVEFDVMELRNIKPVDIVVTPITGQGLPGFELVHGPRASANLVEELRPKFVVPMQNGDVDATGMSVPLIEEIGSMSEFKTKLMANCPQTQVLEVTPGKSIIF